MILVVFFVMLVSYSQISGRSALQIRAALGGKADRTAASEEPGTPAITGEQRAAEAKVLAEAGGVLRGALENASLGRNAVLERTRSGWRMVLGTDALFTEGRETIREPVQPLLREIGKAPRRGTWPSASRPSAPLPEPATPLFPGRRPPCGP
jgi:flagellar motor protein MotB